MKVNGVTNWISIDYQVTSLFDVIANAGYTATHATRSTWKSLIPNSSLQRNCNKQGFNIQETSHQTVKLYVRIGLISNNELDCITCDSYIGFGILYRRTDQPRLDISCGNVFVTHAYRATFGYILVQ